MLRLSPLSSGFPSSTWRCFALVFVLSGVISAAEPAAAEPAPATSAADASVVTSVAQFWTLPIPTGWREQELNQAMQGRWRAQHKIDGPEGQSVLIAVRPDGRESPSIDELFVTNLIDSFIVAAHGEHLEYTRTSVAMITWDGLPAGEVHATLDDGSGTLHAVVFRVLVANGFVYQLRALQQEAGAVDAATLAALARFRLTKNPSVAAPAITQGGVAAPDGVTVADATSASTEETAPMTSERMNPLYVVGAIAGGGILLVCCLPLFKRRRPRRSGSGSGTGTQRRRRESTAKDELGIVPPPPRRPASQRTTNRIPRTPRAERPTEVVPANRRSTVLMPQQPPKPASDPDAKPPGPTQDANVRRRRTNP